MIKKNILSLTLLVSFFLLIISCKTTGVTEGPQQQKQAEQSEILWDSWDVPHIYGQSFEELGYGFGWVQMKSYGNDILKLYGIARGHGAKFWGEDYLPSDRLLHRVGIPQRAEQALGEQPTELRKYLKAFAAGMNDYANKHPQAIDENVRQVLPVQAEDLIRHTQRLMFTFVAWSGSQQPIMGFDGMPTDALIGSNTMAIGPSRSESGNTMLLQNPHLPWNIPFMRFYEAQLVGPDSNLYGSTLIGVPAIMIGFNQQLGWSHTINTADVFDTYRLKLEGKGYHFDGDTKSFDESTKILRVRGEDNELKRDTLEIKRSKHGPVIQSTDSSAIAVRTLMFERHGVLQQFWEMGRAQNFDQFQKALKQLQLPMLTTTYADGDGHIYYLFNGQVPERPFGDFGDWQKPVAGDTSRTVWSDIHDFEELPSVLDPESGFVQNSNSPPWFATKPSPLNPNDYPEYLSPEWLLPREQRGLEMLLADQSISFEELVEMRYSSKMLLADQVISDLTSTAKTSSDSLTRVAASVLEGWDQRANADSKGAVLFTFWALEQCKGHFTNFCNFKEPWNMANPLETPNGLTEPDSAAALLGKVARKVQDQFGRLDIPWGEVMRLSDDIPGTGAPGDPLGVYHVIEYRSTDYKNYRPAFGDTWSAVIEFTRSGPRAEVLMSYGNTSQSSGQDNRQLELISEKQMRPVWYTRKLVEENMQSKTIFRYQR
ncbi:penicillin acylase family protein [Fodinibius sp. AD559]|uniref:penicillin acylase family protein n=1 Tax=Fodinibius sp. AD559 TaxID=3424179 RepID=UPI004046D2E8